MKRLAVMVTLVLMAASCISFQKRPDAGPDRAGSGDFIFTDGRGDPNKPIRVWYYRPSGFSGSTPILFVMHGIKRDARRNRDAWIQFAEKKGYLLLAPEFSHKYYPGIRDYNEGNIFSSSGKPTGENEHAFAVIEHLFDFVKTSTQNQSASYDIYGHSAGGQFVQRMIFFESACRIRTAIAANPCIYVFPTYVESYPYGIRNSGVTPDDLRAAFKKSFILMLSEKDPCDDSYPARDSEVRAHGETGFERGNHFFESAKTEAGRLGMIFNWKMTTVSNAKDLDKELAVAAARILEGEE